MKFKDHFSGHASQYALHRPKYPLALINYLAEICSRRELALDCGCGSGQLSVLLADRFDHVVATDASEKQIEYAELHDRVEYRLAGADESGLADATVDLVTAGQSAHWFPLDRFYAEVSRVTRPDGIVALITYGNLRVDEKVDDVVNRFYHDVLGSFWPPERRHVENGYRDLEFPFNEILSPPPPALAMEVEWTRNQLLKYIDTWSATKALQRVSGKGPVEAFHNELSTVWAESDVPRKVSWPISMRIGRL